MNLEELLSVYRKLREIRDDKTKKRKNKLPEMHLAKVEMTRESIPASSPKDENLGPWKRIEKFQPVEGWLGFQSRNYAFTRGEGLPEPDPEEDGELLSAECVNGDGHSLHLRQDGRGAWIATTYIPGSGDAYLCDIVLPVVAAPPQGDAAANESRSKTLGRLRYRRYWHIDPEHGTRPVAACFIGFGKEEDQQ